ncbi:TonB-dependent receptor [Desertivirga xinjiangensis]|uniref:TonB-dependent receptor n=1 Tax=Desertivirga xinjiangensis TaxID=539206 RepID=UPI0021090773|nr:TonB-dependent receptor [Pedobacter xinjiangensis]
MRNFQILPALLILFLAKNSFAQSTPYTVRGLVQDTSGASLPGAIVKLVSGVDSLSSSVRPDGTYIFNNVKYAAFNLKVAFLGFKNHVSKHKHNNEKVLQLPVVKLSESSNALKEVVVSGITPVRVMEDTIQFSAAAYKVREGDAVEEVIKKLPGVTVDKDGNVTTQGKPITKIRVNGKDFFGSDVATAIQNLPADVVQNLQIIDDYGDQAKLTGIKTGEPEKVLNINIQPDKKKGYFIRGTGGMGNEDRYISSIRGNTFKGDRQLSFDASLNNTNMRGGGGDGITNNRDASFNYRNQWSEKISADGGYQFRNRDNKTISSRYGQTFYTDSLTRFVNDDTNNSSRSDNHNFWGNLELNLDTLNFLKISPNLSYSNSENGSIGLNNTLINKAISIRNSESFNNSLSGNAGTNVFYNHKFLRKGRNFSIWSSINYSKGESDRDSRNNYNDTDTLGFTSSRKQYQLSESFNDNFRTIANFSYIEPLGKAAYLELNYNWNRTETKSSRELNELDTITNNYQFNQNQSNNYQYQFVTNRLGLNYRKLHEKYNYSFGLSAQPAKLKGQDISRNLNTEKETFNWIPNARLVYRFSKQKSLTANYNGRSSQPGFTQLQPITDSTNLQNIVIGNPDLKPEFTHGLNVEYNQSDWSSGYILLGSLSFSQTANKIVTSRTLDPVRARQVTNYLNTDGFYNLRGNYSFSKPFDERKFTLTYQGGANYSNNIAFSNGERNTGKNITLDQGLLFRVDIKDIVDTEISTRYSINKTQYTLSSFSDRQTDRLVMGLNGRNYFFKDLTVGYDFSKTINKGFNSADMANPTILNVFMEYRFLKGNRGSLRLHGFDLFNENTGISRDVFDNEIVDSQVNRLGRYFMCSFNLRLRKFG